MTLRLGLRLALAGGQEALVRLVVMAAGVAVGVLLLLICLSGDSAIQGRADRTGWRSADADTGADAPDEALFLAVTDYHGGGTMSRTYVAALGPEPPVPPGLRRLPGPGEIAVSPALRRLLASTPDDQLDDRYPGRLVATIGDEGLAHPDEFVALIGRTPEQLREVSSGSLVTVRGFDSLPSGYTYTIGLRALPVIGAVLLLVPVAVFVVMATRVAAAHREQRLAAIRLAGATRRQTGIVAGVETGMAAVVGAAVGYLGYEVARRVAAATVSFQGGEFFVEDVAVAPWLLAAVLVGVPALAVLTTVAALSRVQNDPLGASRRGRRAPPSAWRALPFGVGVGGQLAGIPLRGIVDDAVLDRLTPFLVIATLLGFVAMGPWLCMLAGRGIAAVCRRVPALIAARRLGGDPHATFRVVSGVVLAAFTVTYVASLLGPAERKPYADGPGELRPGVVHVFTGGVPADTVAPLLADHPAAVATRFDFGATELVESCSDFARVVVMSCDGAGLPPGYSTREGLESSGMLVTNVYVATDGTRAAQDRVRTQAAALIPNALIHIQQDRLDVDAAYFVDFATLMRVGLQFVMVMTACSLTVGMIAGIVERRRPFALLRASGLRLGELRQVVFLETAAAMLVTAAAGVGLGLATSYVQAVFNDLTWYWPDGGVLATIAVGVLVALGLSTLTLPLLDATTRFDTVRYE